MKVLIRDGRGRWAESRAGITKRSQVELWRSAARGHVANGDPVQALACWNNARRILGRPARIR